MSKIVCNFAKFSTKKRKRPENIERFTIDKSSTRVIKNSSQFLKQISQASAGLNEDGFVKAKQISIICLLRFY